MAGTIEFGGDAINCVIRNMSIGGASLDVTSPICIPDRLSLVFKADGVRIPCHIVWRNDKRIGVAFDYTASCPFKLNQFPPLGSWYLFICRTVPPLVPSVPIGGASLLLRGRLRWRPP
jgi:hypothetical protein